MIWIDYKNVEKLFKSNELVKKVYMTKISCLAGNNAFTLYD